MNNDGTKLLDYCATDLQRETVRAYAKSGSVRKTARALKRDEANVRKTLRTVRQRAAKAGYSPDHDMTRPVPDGFKLKGTSSLYDQDGVLRMQWVKSTADAERQAEMIAEAIQEMCADLPAIPRRKKQTPKHPKALMNVIPFGDPHFGMYAWAEETGDDFDLDIAKRDLCGAVDYLVNQAPPAHRCAILSLGDFFHADNMEGVTTRSGHVLDMDTRLPKVIRVGVSAMRQAIESALDRHDVVDVVCAIGNHDDVLSAALAIMLANLYEKEPRVVVHDQATRRHYLRHGKVLIGITHGHQTKDRDLPGIMATERPADWGETRHRYYYRGHHHHDAKDEFNGCIVEQFRTLAAGDAYTVGAGYLSGRDMKCITHHADYGEVGRVTCSINMLRESA